MLRRMRFLVLLFALILPLNVLAQDAAPALSADDLPDLDGREVTIAVENAYPPYNFISASGASVGWDYDTFRDICALLNCVPVFQLMAWDGMLIAVSQGQVDVAADGITYTADRDESVDFSTLYQAYDETLLVLEDETRFSTVAEFQAQTDLIVGTQLGTTNEVTAHELFGIDRTRSYDPFAVAITALKNGDVDAVVVDRPAAEGFILTEGGMKTFPESLKGIEGLAFAYPPGSDLVAPFDAAKAYLEASGRWDQLLARWFPANLEGREINVAVATLNAPYSANGEGWSYDVVNKICQTIKCTPVFQEMKWSDIAAAVASGEVDVSVEGTNFNFAPGVDFGSAFGSATEQLVATGDWDSIYQTWFGSAE